MRVRRERGPASGWRTEVNEYRLYEDMIMRRYDLSPLLRSTVGFDPVYRLFEAAANGAEAEPTYPPYNIEKKGENDYQIAMAVAGFGKDDLDITVQEGVLVISGKAPEETHEETGEKVFLHRGIARRAFERRFKLADTIKVVSADIENGLLLIALVREIPEHKKPRQITIGGAESKTKVIETQAA